jgi:2-haloacid dehalogenase
LPRRRPEAETLKTPAIDTVVFDLGNVLIDWNPRYLFRKLYGEDVAKMEHFLKEVCSSEWNECQDAGRPWQEGVAEAIARHPDHAEMIRAYHERWEEMLGEPILESVALLEELRRSGFRVLALTNWSHETFPVALERFHFLHWFEGIVVSGQEKLIKPDPAIFRLLISRYRIEPSRAVFIDDNVRNVAGAEQVGMRALHFTSAEKLRRDLRELGLTV